SRAGRATARRRHGPKPRPPSRPATVRRARARRARPRAARARRRRDPNRRGNHDAQAEEQSRRGQALQGLGNRKGRAWTLEPASRDDRKAPQPQARPPRDDLGRRGGSGARAADARPALIAATTQRTITTPTARERRPAMPDRRAAGEEAPRNATRKDRRSGTRPP